MALQPGKLRPLSQRFKEAEARRKEEAKLEEEKRKKSTPEVEVDESDLDDDIEVVTHDDDDDEDDLDVGQEEDDGTAFSTFSEELDREDDVVVSEDDNNSSSHDDDDDGEELYPEDEEEVVHEKPKPKATKKVTKVAQKKSNSKPVQSLFKPIMENPNKGLPEEGGLLTREALVGLYADKMCCTRADAAKAIAGFEELLLEEVFPKWSVNLCGVRFKRSVCPIRYYSGRGGLTVKDDGLVTEVPEHIVVKAQIVPNLAEVKAAKRKGKVDKKGNFIPVVTKKNKH